MTEHDTVTPDAAIPSRATPVRRTPWLRSLGRGLGAWLKKCADSYAAAAAYDDLSRRSDADLRHLSLSRDILCRDLSEGDGVGRRHPMPQGAAAAPIVTVSPLASGRWPRGVRWRALEAAAAVLLMLMALTAIFVPPVLLKGPTHTAARDREAPVAVEPVLDRF